nr:mucin-2-like [Lytechinus pictus]
MLSLFEAGGQTTPLERVRISNIRDSPSGGDNNEYDVSSAPPGMFRVNDTFNNEPVESFDIEVLDETSMPLTIEVRVRGCIEQGEVNGYLFKLQRQLQKQPPNQQHLFHQQQRQLQKQPHHQQHLSLGLMSSGAVAMASCTRCSIKMLASMGDTGHPLAAPNIWRDHNIFHYNSDNNTRGVTIVNALSLFEAGGQNNPSREGSFSNIRPSPSGGDTNEYDVYSSTPPGMFRVNDTFGNAPVESFDIEVLDETSRPLTIEVQVRGCIEQVPPTTTAAPETTTPSTTSVTTTSSTTTVTTTPGVCEEDLDKLNVSIILIAEGNNQSTDGTITLVSGVNIFNIELSIPGYMTIVNALSLFEAGGQNTPLERVRISNIRPSPSGGDTNEYDVSSTPPGMFRVNDTFGNAPVESFDIEVLDETSRPLTIEVQVRGCIEQVPPTTTAAPETTTPSTTSVTTTSSTTTVTTTPGVCEEDLDKLNVSIILIAEGNNQSTDETITLVSGVNKFNIELSIPGYMTIVNALSLFEAGGQNTPLERVRISNIRPSPSGGDTNEYDVSSTPPGMFRVNDTFGTAPVESFDIEVLDETSRPLTIEVQVRGCIEQVPTTTTAAPETTTQSTTPVPPTTTAAPETTTPSTTSGTTTPYVCYDDLTSTTYQVGQIVLRPCETCSCVQDMGLMCSQTSCNLQSSDCQEGQIVAETADNCCECRDMTTTMTTTPACMAPRIYRTNCDCQRTCEDIVTPCATPPPNATCEYGCFCEEGMVAASVNNTDCVLEEECFPVCEYNNQTYQYGEKYQDIDDPCLEYTCLGDSLATSRFECSLPCEWNEYPTDCCIECQSVTTPKDHTEKACIFAGQKYQVGTIIQTDFAIPCMVMKCNDDGILVFVNEVYDCTAGCQDGVEYPHQCCDECIPSTTTAAPETTTPSTTSAEATTTVVPVSTTTPGDIGDADVGTTRSRPRQTATTTGAPETTTPSTTPEGITTSPTPPRTTTVPTTTVTLTACHEDCHVTFTCYDQWSASQSGDAPWEGPAECRHMFGSKYRPQCKCQEGYIKDDISYGNAMQITMKLGRVHNTGLCVKPLEGECMFCEHEFIPYAPNGYYRENCEVCTCKENTTSQLFYFECVPTDDATCVRDTTSSPTESYSTLTPTTKLSPTTSVKVPRTTTPVTTSTSCKFAVHF